MRYLLLLALCAALVFPVAARAGVDDATAVAEAEEYMNARHSFAAKFIQTTDNGQTVTGSLLVSRPGKMNLSYDPPLQDFIIADGSFLYMWDGELEQSTTLPLGGNLADLILRHPLRLSGDVRVIDVMQDNRKMEIELVEAENPDNGTLTLMFDRAPSVVLKGWRVRDTQARVTTVTLIGLRENVEIPPRSFAFMSPKLGKGKGDKPIN